MGQLVQDGDGAPLHARLDGPGAEDVVVAVGDAFGVLHGPGVELGYEDLVVLSCEVLRQRAQLHGENFGVHYSDRKSVV